MNEIFHRPETGANPDRFHWRIGDGAGVLGYVLDADRNPKWPHRPRSRRFIPYVGGPYPDGIGLDPVGTLSAAVDALRAYSARRGAVDSAPRTSG